MREPCFTELRTKQQVGCVCRVPSSFLWNRVMSCHVMSAVFFFVPSSIEPLPWDCSFWRLFGTGADDRLHSSGADDTCRDCSKATACLSLLCFACSTYATAVVFLSIDRIYRRVDTSFPVASTTTVEGGGSWVSPSTRCPRHSGRTRSALASTPSCRSSGKCCAKCRKRWV